MRCFNIVGKLLIIAAVLCLGGWAVYGIYPAYSYLFPKCLFYQLTGLYCPGCGSTRALHYLLCGDYRRALHDNVFFVLLLPLFAVWIFQQLRRWVWKTPLSDFWHTSPLPYYIGIIILVYTLARNLPWWPFSLLAPLPD